MTATSHPDHNINLIGILLKDAYRAATCGSKAGWLNFDNLVTAIVNGYPDEEYCNKVCQLHRIVSRMPHTLQQLADQLPPHIDAEWQKQALALLDELQEFQPEIKVLQFLYHWLKHGYGFRREDIVELSELAVCDLDIKMVFKTDQWYELCDAIRYWGTKEQGRAMGALCRYLKQHA